MKLGYVRVSTLEQNTIRQEVLMKELGVEEVFIDKASGKNTNRPELKRLLEFARSGDTVIVESISRFARNTKDLLELIDILTKKGVEFISKKEAIDTTTASGIFMITVFAAVSELERNYILIRQKEGIEQAKLQGKYKGRKKILNPNFENIYIEWKKGKITASKAMQLLHMKKSTFYRRAREYEEGRDNVKKGNKLN